MLQKFSLQTKKSENSAFKTSVSHKLHINQTTDGLLLIVSIQHATWPHTGICLYKAQQLSSERSIFIFSYQYYTNHKENRKCCYYPSHIITSIKENSKALDKRIINKHTAKFKSESHREKGLSSVAGIKPLLSIAS